MTKRDRLIEVAARAMAEREFGPDIDRFWVQDTPESMRNQYVRIATAGLDATLAELAEPDEAMVEAGCVAIHKSFAYDDGAHNCFTAMLAKVAKEG